MSEPKRYDIGARSDGYMAQSQDGDWVSWEDYEKLRSKLDAADQAFHEIRSLCDAFKVLLDNLQKQ